MKLLLERGAVVNAQGSSGRTALYHACAGGRVDVVRELLSYGADPNLAESYYNAMPLH